MLIDFDLQKRYATTLLELEQLNKDLNKVLHEVQQYCCEVGHSAESPESFSVSANRRKNEFKNMRTTFPYHATSSPQIRAWLRRTVPQSCADVAKKRPSRWSS